MITGKLKNDAYSLSLKKIINNNPGIILTNYISETLKSTLYLNALVVTEPSMIEGFGSLFLMHVALVCLVLQVIVYLIKKF